MLSWSVVALRVEDGEADIAQIMIRDEIEVAGMNSHGTCKFSIKCRDDQKCYELQNQSTF